MTSTVHTHLGPLKLADSPVDQPARASTNPALPAEDIAGKWLEQFNHAIVSRDADAVVNLFREDGIKNFKIVLIRSLVEGYVRLVMGVSYVSYRPSNQGCD